VPIKILLVFPPLTLEERYAKNVGKVGGFLPPIGLAYIAAVLQREGIEVEIIDAPALELTLEETLSKIMESGAEIVGISTLTPTIKRSLRLAEYIKHASPDQTIVLGGPHASIFPIRTMKECPATDIIVRGEGEITTLNLVRALETGKNLNQVRGLAIRDKNGEPKLTGQGPFVEDLDSLPFPARDLLPMDKYRTLPNAYRRLPVVHMLAGRGCPFSCTFCSKAVFGRKHRVRSPQNVLEEIKLVVDRYHAREIAFWDDVFTIRRKWTLEFCRLLREEKIDILWSCESRVDLVDRELLEEMARAGCWNIFYGVETAYQELLDRIGKGVTVDQVRKAIEITKRAGIEIRASFMFALPGETPEMAEETIRYAIELDPDYAQFNITTPYPGTKLYKTAKQFGELSEDYDKYIMWEPVFVPKGYEDENQIKEIQRRAFRRFYLRPKYFLRRLFKIESFSDLKRNLAGLRMVAGFL